MKKILKLSLVVIFLNSCIGIKKLSYMQDVESVEKNSEGLLKTSIEEYRLQQDDVISIIIKASDPDINKLFGAFSANSSTESGGNLSFQGQVVDKNGEVSILGLGTFKLSGKTLFEARKEIQQKLDEKFYKSNMSVVDVRLEGIYFNIMGEINSPGPKLIKRSRVDLLEAISFSGDLTRVADREKIILIRQYPEGKKQVFLDVTKASIVNSPYFYLHPNDIIIANPRREKITGIGTNTVLSDVIQISTLAITAITIYFFARSF